MSTATPALTTDTNPFEHIAALAAARQVRNINTMPGCWEVQLDECWWFAVNGHDRDTRCSKGAAVPPFNAYVEYAGTPMGFLDPFGGVFLGGDEGCDDFNAALVVVLGASQ